MTNDDELPQDDPYADFYETAHNKIRTATQEDMLLRLDVRAREVALERAVELHRQSNHDIETTAQQTLFTARAFYEFLTGESDEDLQTEQSQ